MRLAWPGLLWLPHILFLLNFLVWAGRFSPPSPHYGRCCYSRCQRHCHQRHRHQRIHRYPPLMHIQFIELIFIEPSLLNSSRIYARERAPSKRNGLRMAGEFGSAATWERWRSGGLGAQIRGWRFFFLVGGRPRLPPPTSAAAAQSRSHRRDFKPPPLQKSFLRKSPRIAEAENRTEDATGNKKNSDRNPFPWRSS